MNKRDFMSRAGKWAVWSVLAIATGCGSQQPAAKSDLAKDDKAPDSNRPEIPNEAKTMPKSVEPPKYPRPQHVALDPELQRAARKEIAINYDWRAKDSDDPLDQIEAQVRRSNAIEAMRVAPRPEDESLIVLALSDPSPQVRKSAAIAVGELKIQMAKPKLLLMINTDESRVLVAVKFALHRLGDTTYSHDFESYARDPDFAVRGDTAMVLGLMGEPSGLVILKVMRRDHDTAIRLQVCEAMWRLHDASALDDLVGATLSRYTDDQMIAFLALAAPRDPSVIEHLRGGLTTDFPRTNLVAARALGMLGSDEGYGVAMAAVESDDPRKRALCAFAFGAIGRSDSQQYLAKLVKDREAPVRLAAATAILQLKP